MILCLFTTSGYRPILSDDDDIPFDWAELVELGHTTLLIDRETTVIEFAVALEGGSQK